MSTKPLPWFRLYGEMIDDEKVRLLAFEDRWHYVALLCCKCAGLLDAGDKPELLRRKLGVKLGLAQRELEAAATRLAEVGLIDAETFQPLGWNVRQFVSDSSYERVKRHREKRAAAGLVQQVSIPKEVRGAVFARDGHACVYCGSQDDLTIDHDVPEMRGGNHDAENLLTACRPCNASKRDMTAAEFRERNGAETLLKRPQIKRTDTEEETKQEQRAPRKRAAAVEVALPEWLDPKAWSQFVEFRKRKAPLTARAAELAIAELGKLRDQGHDPVAVINQSILNGWRGLFALKDNHHAAHRSNHRGHRESEAERVQRINRELDERERNGAPPGF